MAPLPPRLSGQSGGDGGVLPLLQLLLALGVVILHAAAPAEAIVDRALPVLRIVAGNRPPIIFPTGRGDGWDGFLADLQRPLFDAAGIANPIQYYENTMVRV
jgi:hypothetical protein